MDFSTSYDFIDIFPRCTKDEVAEFERKLGSRLPDDYRAFLLAHNGVVFMDVPAFELLDAEEEEEEKWNRFSYVNLLWGLAPGSPEDPGWYEQANAIAAFPAWGDLRTGGAGLEFEYRVPARIIAIGDNTVHHRICISVAGDDKGTVYLWRPLLLWEENPVPSMDFLHPVAASFTEFWNSFVPSDVLDDEDEDQDQEGS